MKSFNIDSLIKKLPNFIRKRIENRDTVKKVTANIGWLFFDKFLKMSLGMVVGMMVARYLEPEKYGIWNYAIAFSSLFGAVATLGIDRIAVREIVSKPDRHNELLGTLFVLRLIAGLAIVLLSTVIVYVIKGGDLYITVIVALCSFSYVFQAVMVVDYFYQAELKCKYTVYAQNAAFLLIAVIKIILIIVKAPLVAFIISGMGEVLLGSILIVITYFKNGRNTFKWRYSKILAINFLKDSWPYIISSIAGAVYMRIDQVMIGNMLDQKAVGIYSAAVKISEIWFFVPMGIVASLFPSIIKSRSLGEKVYLSRMQKTCDFLTLFGVVVAVCIGFFCNVIVAILYGDAYAQAGPVLSLHVWTGAVICLGATGGIWIAAENLQIVTIVKTLAGAITNVSLNLWWIPLYMEESIFMQSIADWPKV